ncbi:MAG TPA: membrane protein insertase YidC [Chitinophagaceae bacterium]|nr:membrane protein insertase YidC [Chitinophagaceae bacterium]HNF71474.1 membrane protein insertase YidC [Chitinophagaceae bacterium]
MDKNTIAGFGLLMLLLVGYIVYNDHSEKQYRAQLTKDSIAQAKLHPAPPKKVTVNDTLPPASPVADTSARVQTPETLTVLENEQVAITFTNKGAYPRQVLLKKFKTQDGKPLLLYANGKNSLDLAYTSKSGSRVHSKSENFTLQTSPSNLRYSSPEVTIAYHLPENSYMLEMKIDAPNATPQGSMDMQWDAVSMMSEKDVESQKMYSQVCYQLDQEGYDYFTIKEKKSEAWKHPVQWLSFKQHYFNSTIIPADQLVQSAKVQVAPLADTQSRALNNFSAMLTLNPRNTLSFQWFLGPNDYSLLKSYHKNLEEIIPLSYGIFGFVKYINTWLIIPIFNMLSRVFSSYGMVILLLTFIIRLLMSPFTYKSYVSSAKMKALKPDLDALREKYGDDKQTFGVEQMKLYRQAGVNPLGGCLPALLQLPVFFALLSFFPHAIELRQSSFLWAKDLSTYDSIVNLPFNIPFYGNHVSLFTLLFVITSLLLSLYSMNNMAGQDQNNPMMKYLPFIMPVMFLGIFNKLPAALTYYYFVSNVITLGLQFVIQNYIIDSKKIHEQIQAKKSEAPKENKFMARMMEMQKQQQEKMKQQRK